MHRKVEPATAPHRLLRSVPAAKLELAASVLRRVQRYKRWKELFGGRCGPAAIAINAVLFRGRGTYVVLLDRPSDKKLPSYWSGHVAVSFGRGLFDYQGQLSWHELACWPARPGRDSELATEAPTLLVGVDEKHIHRKFVIPCASDEWVPMAKDCLERALKYERKGMNR